MVDFFKTVEWLASHPLSGGVRANQVGELGFDLVKFREKSIVVTI